MNKIPNCGSQGFEVINADGCTGRFAFNKLLAESLASGMNAA